ncbi:MAG TPA: AbrB family transcriptional regulator [Desulfobulbaceae bacterium]|nr:AbrB family transcriptional regulator [Desulfobulbaceae bacterium]
MKITSKGQVTIPQEIRRKAGLLPHTEVVFQMKGNTVQIVKADSPQTSRGKRLTAMIRGSATVRLTTDEIMALTRGEN